MLVHTNGIDLHVDMKGNGLPLVLLQGFTGSAANWKPFIPCFSQQFQVIAIDVIGHANSSAPRDSARYSMEKAANDIISLLDRLEVEKVHLLGYSMGGRLALALACDYPERVRSLVLESASPGLHTKAERAQRIARDERLADFIEEKGVREFVDYWESIPLFQTQHRVAPEKRDQLRKTRLFHSERGLANSLRGMGTGRQPSFWDRLSTVPIPVKLIAGERDEKFITIAKAMGEYLPVSELSIAPDTGHSVHFENEVFFEKTVLDFLDSMRGV